MKIQANPMKVDLLQGADPRLIQWISNQQGYETFDWGKTDLDNQVLRDFKCGWGSQEQTLHYSVLADHSPVAKLPGGMRQHLMAGVIQHSPARIEWLGPDCLVIFAERGVYVGRSFLVKRQVAIQLTLRI